MAKASKTPPVEATYSLEGLTKDEAQLIKHLVGRSMAADVKEAKVAAGTHEKLYDAISAVFPSATVGCC